MAAQSYVFAGVAGYVGRPDQVGKVGVFRRPADGGEWSQVMGDAETHVVMVHPTNPDIVLAGTVDGVRISTDHGATFKKAQFPDTIQIWSFLVDRRDPKRILAGASPVAFYESRDMGASWTALPDSGIQEREKCAFRHRAMRMVQHPTRPDTVYAALEVNGVVRSEDFGRTWSDCSEHLIELSKLPHLKSKILTQNEAEGMLDGHAITMSAAEPDAVVVACRMGLFKSTDKGRTWTDLEMKRFSPITYGRDVRVSAQDPNTVYAALSVAAASHDGAVYRSNDAGKTWSRFDKVQVHGTIMSIGLSDKNPDEVYIGARYQGEVFGTRDGGKTWTPMPIPGPVKDIYCVACG
ncbi:MAG: YCF48-related protein [Hyphomicrobiaceae bacterium]|nr:YCF48-related protein [Hyphomicrobiaceae bacterium]